MVRRGFWISTTPPSYAVTMVELEPSLSEDWRWTTPSTVFPIWSLHSFWPQWLSTRWPWWLCVSWPRSSVLRTVSYPNMCMQVTKLEQEAIHATWHTLSGPWSACWKNFEPRYDGSPHTFSSAFHTWMYRHIHVCVFPGLLDHPSITRSTLPGQKKYKSTFDTFIRFLPFPV